jgi:hypothetical protein
MPNSSLVRNYTVSSIIDDSLFADLLILISFQVNNYNPEPSSEFKVNNS